MSSRGEECRAEEHARILPHELPVDWDCPRAAPGLAVRPGIHHGGTKPRFSE